MSAKAELQASEKSDKKSYFVPVTDLDVIRDVFRVAMKERTALHLWLKDRKIDFEGRISYLQGRVLFVDLPSRISNEIWDQSFMQGVLEGESTIFANLTVNKFNFFMKLTVQSREDRSLRIQRPDQIYKLQRRTFTRMRLSYVRKIYASIKNIQSTFRILDVSGGGLAIAVSPAQMKWFQPNDVISNLSFELGRRKINEEVVVKRITKAKDEGGIAIMKVGLMFTDGSMETVNAIESFILQESQNIFSTLDQ